MKRRFTYFLGWKGVGRVVVRLNVYLIVVERLVDNTRYGFAFVRDTNEHRHIIQEA